MPAKKENSKKYTRNQVGLIFTLLKAESILGFDALKTMKTLPEDAVYLYGFIKRLGQQVSQSDDEESKLAYLEAAGLNFCFMEIVECEGNKNESIVNFLGLGIDDPEKEIVQSRKNNYKYN